MELKFEKLTIYEVEDLRNLFLIELEKGNINLDFSYVKKIDLSVIQLLVSLKKSCDEKKLKFNISNLEDDVKLNLSLSGVDSFLGV